MINSHPADKLSHNTAQKKKRRETNSVWKPILVRQNVINKRLIKIDVNIYQNRFVCK